MTNDRLAKALEVLRDLLEDSRVGDILAPFSLYSILPRPAGNELLECFARISVARARFSDADLDLIRGMGLQPLVDASWWAEILRAVSRTSIPEGVAAELAMLCSRIEVLQGGLPAMMALLEPGAPGLGGEDTLEVRVTDNFGRVAPLALVSDAIMAVHQIWTVLQELAGLSESLLLSGCQPGLTTVLVFAGSRGPLQELKSTLAALLAQPGGPGEAALTPLTNRIVTSGRDDAATLIAVMEDAIRRFLLAGCTLPPQPGVPPAGPPADIAERLSLAVETANLADVILDERRQLTAANGNRSAR